MKSEYVLCRLTISPCSMSRLFRLRSPIQVLANDARPPTEAPMTAAKALVTSASMSYLLNAINDGNCIKLLVPAVRRIADIGIHLRAVVEDAAGVRVGAESPLAVVLAHPGVANTPERKVGNQWMDCAVVDYCIPRCRFVQDVLRHALLLGEHVQTQWARPGIDEVDDLLDAIDLQDRKNRSEERRVGKECR